MTDNDWLHLHYRDKALLLARGLPIREFFLSLFCKAGSSSAGRQMSAHLSDPARHVLSLVGPVGNNALQAVGVAAAIRDQPGEPIVVCSVGDGTTQQGEFLEAVAEAVRDALPVLFVVHDNQFAISVRTPGRTFFSLPDGPGRELFGLPLHFVDGADPLLVDDLCSRLIPDIRQSRRPGILVLRMARLADHSNADDQERYRDPNEISRDLELKDPITRLEQYLTSKNVSSMELDRIRQSAISEVAVAAEEAFHSPDPVPTLTASAPLPTDYLERREQRGTDSLPRLNMREALNATLHERLLADPRIVLLGEDIEDPKGDVFGVTRGLSTEFPERVRNSALSESTIVGTCIGRALAGQRPVAFIQFADFLPLAWNQIASELGSMYWRSNGGWQCPVIVIVTCGGYKPGLGPFHAQTMESLAAHTPGIDVVMPSTAADAAGLLNAAFESGRPTLFFYPKACLNLAEEATSSDVASQFLPVGSARVIRTGSDVTLVSWGTPLQQCRQAATLLGSEGIYVELIDLRSLAPWDEAAVLRSARITRRLVVVHEDNVTCGFGAEVLARIAERSDVPIVMRRVARPDVYIPCHFGSQLEVLPSCRAIVTTIADLLGQEVRWVEPDEMLAGRTPLVAIGSGPADESVVVVSLSVREGDHVALGDVVAELEATKSVFELSATTTGIVERVLVQVGDTIPVGQALCTIRTPDEAGPSRPRPVTKEIVGRPILHSRGPLDHRKTVVGDASANSSVSPTPSPTTSVYLSGIYGVTGSRQVSNEELLAHHPGRTAEQVFTRTGIDSRCWAGEGENVLTLAVAAVRGLQQQSPFALDELDLVIACTTTPLSMTPSLACRVISELSRGSDPPRVAAYDINAACSGYLYALRQAWDFLQQQPDGRVLVITSEVLSPLVDVTDFDTAFLFGDAATATLVVGRTSRTDTPDHNNHDANHRGSRPPDADTNSTRSLHLHRPILSGRPEDGSCLSVPLTGDGHIRMNGPAVFEQAVRSMTQSLKDACRASGLSPSDLHVVIPHQANQRILDAIARRSSVSVYSHLRHIGNTSSSSLPLALRSYLNQPIAALRIGLCTFGGGFTSAAVVADITQKERVQ